MANSYYKMGQYEESQKLFESLTKSQDLKLAEKSFYNLGNTAYRQGRLKEAVEYYQEALKLDPTDEDVKFNLEFVRKEIKRRLEENQKQQQQKKQQCNNPQQQDGQQDQQQQKDQKQDQKQDGQKKQQEQQKAAVNPTPSAAPAATPTPMAAASDQKEKQGQERIKRKETGGKMALKGT
jgi:Ca-activated chloride channel family protein